MSGDGGSIADWREWQQRFAHVKGLTAGDLGIHLLEAMRAMPSKLGSLCNLVHANTHHSFALEDLVTSKDILPLPMILLSAEDVKSLHAEVRESYGRMVETSVWDGDVALQARRLQQVTAWVTVMITVVNFLFLGFGHESFAEVKKMERVGAAQMESIHRFYIAADDFIKDDSATLPGKDWGAILQGKRVGYDGEVVSKAVDLTMEQVLPALPPKNIGGSIAALDLASGEMRNLLANPLLNIKPREEWPTELPRARMRIAKDEWMLLGPELVKRKLMKPVHRDELVYHNGKALLNGIFGVSKGKTVKSESRGCDVDILRLIINLVPSNELQWPIGGDVDTLPHFGQWSGLELLDDEVLVWNSEDIQCAFYVFQLPDEWLPWFALDYPLPGHLVGLSGDEPYHLAACVVPMGWLSAVGVCQAFLRKLVQEAGVPGSKELRKDRALPIEVCQRVLRFHQEYIDNYDGGKVRKRDSIPKDKANHDVFSDQWQEMVVNGYRAWGVPRAADKSTEGFHGATLGGCIDGDRGWIALGTVKSMELAEATFYILKQDPPTRKDVSMVSGRWVFVFQFRRTMMVILMEVFDVVNLKVVAWKRVPALAEEMMMAMAMLPLLGMDLRQRVSSVVTCSDASETGAGVCVSRSLTDVGLARLHSGMRAAGGNRANGLCAVETFAGIGGMRRGLEILGVVPGLYLHAEVDEGANRVVQSNYPDQVALGDVTKISEVQLRGIIRMHPEVTHVLHGYGPPCQNVTGLNAMGAGVTGEKSKLVDEVPRIQTILHRVFPDCKHGKLGEMVASLSRQDQAHYDDISGSLPVRICPSSFGWARRPRLWWPSWALALGDDVKVEETDRWTSLKLEAKRMPMRRWLTAGWKLKVPDATFPTFVRAQKRKKPPFKPAGIDVLKPHELARYGKFEFIFPPYQFQDKHMVVSPHGELRPPTATMREVMMGFPRDYTHSVWPAAMRRSSPEDFDLARCSLLGNTWHAGVAAWLCSQILAEWGIIDRPATVAEVSDPGTFACLGGTVTDDEVEQTLADGELSLVRMYMARQSHRGGEVVWLSDRGAGKSVIPPGIDAREWSWRDVISTRWTMKGEHINVLECRAIVLSLRWRYRQIEHVGTKHLHLVDSRVCLGIVAKGRTSSWRLRRVLGKVNALVIAGHGSTVLGFVRTHINPADRPSRRAGRSRLRPPCHLPCEHFDCICDPPRRLLHSGYRCIYPEGHDGVCDCGRHGRHGNFLAAEGGQPGE